MRLAGDVELAGLVVGRGPRGAVGRVYLVRLTLRLATRCRDIWDSSPVPPVARRPARARRWAPVPLRRGLQCRLSLARSLFGHFGQLLHTHQRLLEVLFGVVTIAMGLFFAGWWPGSWGQRERRVHYLPSRNDRRGRPARRALRSGLDFVSDRLWRRLRVSPCRVLTRRLCVDRC
jgi:hypothetical protein